MHRDNFTFLKKKGEWGKKNREDRIFKTCGYILTAFRADF
jgi:hypothetical protein